VDVITASLITSTAKTKQPYAFDMVDHQPFAWLWDAWKDPAGNWLQSFSIITTGR
jgi:putative SOS response-associated peptidase YedK